MLQTICNDIGKIMLEGCANAGRLLFNEREIAKCRDNS